METRVNYLSVLLALALAAAVTTASIYRADSIRDKAALTTLKASYATAAAAAETHAQAVEAADLAKLQQQSSTVISGLQLQVKGLQKANEAYQNKGNSLAKQDSDLGHKCFAVQIPGDLIP